MAVPKPVNLDKNKEAKEFRRKDDSFKKRKNEYIRKRLRELGMEQKAKLKRK